MSTDFEFNQKLRIIGFYNKVGQKINKERTEPEAADKLAELLQKSFKSLIDNPSVDDVFRSVLKGNSVFILKGENNELYAYCPHNNIARISNVKYVKQEVTAAPLIYKGWFIPGQEIPLIQAKNTKPRQTTKGQSPFIIARSGSDFLITHNNQTLPLDWSEDNYISFSDLRALVSHKYIRLEIYNTKDRCGDCDGYDYSNCDMDRCKNDCETCGGRRYKCNNGCFYYRYDRALELEVDEDKVYDLINPINERLEEANTPHCKEYHEIYSQIEDSITEIQSELSLLLKYDFDIPEYDKMIKNDNHYQILSAARDKALTEKPISIFGIRVSPSNVDVDQHGILFWKKWHIETIGDAYDYGRDKLVEFDFKLYTPEEGIIDTIKKSINNKNSAQLSSALSKVKIKDKNISYY